MICPFCNSRIPDGSAFCPACRADLSMTGSFAAIEGDFCPSCGALVPQGETSCPSCGTPVTTRPVAQEPPEWVLDLPEVDERLSPSAGETTVIPRIESAIAAEGERREDEIAAATAPHPVPVFFVAVLALVVVGGAALALSHPWDPHAYEQRPTTEFDTSWAGFPGFFERLTGQDSDTSAPVEVLSGDEATYGQLIDIYRRLGALADRVDANVDEFERVATTGDREARTSGRAEAGALAIEVSNLIAELDMVDVSSGTYAEDAGNISTLGNWLRNRVDTLVAAWDVSLGCDDPAANAGNISAALHVDDNTLGKNTYMSLFHDHYEGWEPAAPEES